MDLNCTLTAELLRDLVVYDPASGTISWRVRWSKNQKHGPLGKPARGRLHMRIGPQLYYVHRLVWLYHHDEWPDGEIDHINGDPLDNRIENLRVVTRSENIQNRRARGVVFDKRACRWYAQIWLDGKKRHIGSYASEAEAMDAYRVAKRTHHKSWATGVGAEHQDDAA